MTDNPTPLTAEPPPAPHEGEISWMQGIAIAWEARALLSDVCERITVGGSLRRGKPFVGDVEIIAQPGADNVERFKCRCDALLTSGRFAVRLNKLGRRIAWGERYKAVKFRGFALDLFIVLPDRQWGPTCVIRTGPNAANQVLVTTAGQKTTLGDAGVLPTGFAFSDGGVAFGGARLDTPEEIDVFNACGLPWVEPSLRTVQTYQDAARSRMKGSEYIGRALGDASLIERWDFVKFEGRYYHLDMSTLLARRPELAAEVERLKQAEEVDVIEQGSLWRARELM